MLSVLREPGSPLDASSRADMGRRLGQDLGAVTVHTGPAAEASAVAVGARAYTVGSHIVFDAGQYSPATADGRRLLAHELVHVVQQGARPSPIPSLLEVGPAGSPLEGEADRVADAVVTAEPAAAAAAARHAPDTTVSEGDGQLELLVDGFAETAFGGTYAPPAIGRSTILLRRSCGPTAIGSPAGCAPSDAVVAGERFLFKRGCDEFRHPPDYPADEEARLVSFGATVARGDTIIIHGFASLDGDATFNTNLSCARAIASQRVLSPITPPVIFVLALHGATPGDAEEQRSVVIDKVPAEPPARPVVPEEPPDPNLHVCGPDISGQLATVLSEVRATWATWSSSQRDDACSAITSIRSAKMAWDIHDLFLPKTGWLRSAPFQPPCGMPAAPASSVEDPATCGNSVQVSDKCFLAGTVNYAIFGQICRLCCDEFGRLCEQTMLDLILLWKTLNWLTLDFDDPGPPSAWARAAFQGFPGHIPVSANRAHCTGRCLVPVARTFRWVWEPHHPR